MIKRSFEFPVKVIKAYEDKAGDKHVIAVASDTGIDWYQERMALSALEDMIKYAKMTKENKPEEGLVDLLETHWSTFGIGFLVDGFINRNVETGFYEFVCDIKLKMSYAMAQELYDDVSKGVCDKQLSVGGWIDGEEGYDWEEVEFTDEDGNKIMEWIGVIKGFILDHVACTREGWAANPRTGFLSAIAKSLHSNEYQNKSKEWAVERSKREDIVTKDALDKNKPQKITLEKVYNNIGKAVYNLFKGGDIDRMENLDKAKSLAEELKSILGTLPVEGAEEIKKSLGLDVVKSEEVVSEGVLKSEEVKPLTMDEVVAKATEMLEAKATEILAKSREDFLAEMTKVSTDISTKMAEVSTKVDSLLPISEKIAGLDVLTTSLDEVKKSIGDRLEILENAAPNPKGADGVNMSKVEIPVVKTSVW